MRNRKYVSKQSPRPFHLRQGGGLAACFATSRRKKAGIAIAVVTLLISPAEAFALDLAPGSSIGTREGSGNGTSYQVVKMVNAVLSNFSNAGGSTNESKLKTLLPPGTPCSPPFSPPAPPAGELKVLDPIITTKVKEISNIEVYSKRNSSRSIFFETTVVLNMEAVVKVIHTNFPGCTLPIHPPFSEIILSVSHKFTNESDNPNHPFGSDVTATVTVEYERASDGSLHYVNSAIDFNTLSFLPSFEPAGWQSSYEFAFLAPLMIQPRLLAASSAADLIMQSYLQDIESGIARIVNRLDVLDTNDPLGDFREAAAPLLNGFLQRLPNSPLTSVSNLADGSTQMRFEIDSNVTPLTVKGKPGFPDLLPAGIPGVSTLQDSVGGDIARFVNLPSLLSTQQAALAHVGVYNQDINSVGYSLFRVNNIRGIDVQTGNSSIFQYVGVNPDFENAKVEVVTSLPSNLTSAGYVISLPVTFETLLAGAMTRYSFEQMMLIELPISEEDSVRRSRADIFKRDASITAFEANTHIDVGSAEVKSLGTPPASGPHLPQFPSLTTAAIEGLVAARVVPVIAKIMENATIARSERQNLNMGRLVYAPTVIDNVSVPIPGFPPVPLQLRAHDGKFVNLNLGNPLLLQGSQNVDAGASNVRLYTFDLATQTAHAQIESNLLDGAAQGFPGVYLAQAPGDGARIIQRWSKATLAHAFKNGSAAIQPAVNMEDYATRHPGAIFDLLGDNEAREYASQSIEGGSKTWAQEEICLDGIRIRNVAGSIVQETTLFFKALAEPALISVTQTGPEVNGQAVLLEEQDAAECNPSPGLSAAPALLVND